MAASEFSLTRPQMIETSRTYPTWWSDYLALTKPRILLMILLTVVMGLLGYAQRSISLGMTLHVLIGTALIAASASILNQWLEQDRDSLMNRTRSRPLPSGRLTSIEAATFGWVTALLGFGYLIACTNLSATLVGFATWVSYVWIYTPMKSWTWWNTVVGTLPGALPVMIGWTAAGGGLWDIGGWLLTSIVILWQFPHFMAIAWLYRTDYDLAGYKMITNVQPSGVAAGWLALIPALGLMPVSYAVILPMNWLTWSLLVLAWTACIFQFRAAWRFFRNRNDQLARRLLYASLLYLPSMMVIAMVVACL